MTDFFSWAPKSLWTVTAAVKLQTLAPWIIAYYIIYFTTMLYCSFKYAYFYICHTPQI